MRSENKKRKTSKGKMVNTAGNPKTTGIQKRLESKNGLNPKKPLLFMTIVVI